MQYILNEIEYRKLTDAKESVDMIDKILKENYDKTKLTYNFDDESYRKVRKALGWFCGSGFKVNILGTNFQICKD